MISPIPPRFGSLQVKLAEDYSKIDLNIYSKETDSQYGYDNNGIYSLDSRTQPVLTSEAVGELTKIASTPAGERSGIQPKEVSKQLHAVLDSTEFKKAFTYKAAPAFQTQAVQTAYKTEVNAFKNRPYKTMIPFTLNLLS
jgi:hypothetical protein